MAFETARTQARDLLSLFRRRRLVEKEQASARRKQPGRRRQRAGSTQNRLTLIAKTLSNAPVSALNTSNALSTKTALPAAAWSALRCRAVAIAFAERSIAVSRPNVNLSQTRAAATPLPQPISSKRSLPATPRTSIAHKILWGTPTFPPLRGAGQWRPRGLWTIVAADSQGEGTRWNSHFPGRRPTASG